MLDDDVRVLLAMRDWYTFSQGQSVDGPKVILRKDYDSRSFLVLFSADVSLAATLFF